ncbi:unnamed protein product [Notodromas monacha]|uniref:Uncharacterized protein n=1 Tax=Notodromas monacha TaxID=399045 RepID=A0A7R9GJR2_9CRUS|nr:unnamed protein product [Notodromas monacha]CAG0923844.1 unnamed protein product [Notodromas monacha]
MPTPDCSISIDELLYPGKLQRIFLEEAAPRRVMIAITDFPPKILDFTVMGLTLNRGRQYESLYSVLQRADTWLRQQVSLNVVTVQTIPQREEFYGTDETETFFVEPALASVDILRILRVAYVRELDDFRDEITENRATSFSGSLSLSCKIFAPEKQSLAEETRDAQIRRVLNWLDTNEDVSQLLWLETGLFKRHEEWRMAEILHKGDVVYKDKSTDYWDTHYRFCIRAFYIGPRKKTTTEQKLYLSRINANAFGFGKCSVS